MTRGSLAGYRARGLGWDAESGKPVASFVTACLLLGNQTSMPRWKLRAWPVDWGAKLGRQGGNFQASQPTQKAEYGYASVGCHFSNFRVKTSYAK